MQLGTLKQNPAGTFIGRIVSAAFVATVALRVVESTNERAPKFDILVLNTVAREWVKAGALFENFSNKTGESFLNGKIDDPSMASPLYLSAFMQADGTYNLVWQRPVRKSAVPVAPTSDDAMPPVPAGDDSDHGGDTGQDDKGQSTDGLGDSTAPDADTKVKGRGARQLETV